MLEKNDSKLSISIVFLGGFLAAGLILGAYVLGHQTKGIGSGKSTIVVKGLAEKSVKADTAEWNVSASAIGADFKGALEKLRQEKKELDAFLTQQGIGADIRADGEESVSPRFVEKEGKNGQTRQVHEGFTASQNIVVTTKDLNLMTKINKAMLNYLADGHSVGYSSPSYLVSNLEDIKISLIGAATENAKRRAGEFIKYGDTKLGSMRSASQGAFYILAPSPDSKADDYGGVYDKSTIDKVARVVVTIEFNIN